VNVSGADAGGTGRDGRASPPGEDTQRGKKKSTNKKQRSGKKGRKADKQRRAARPAPVATGTAAAPGTTGSTPAPGTTGSASAPAATGPASAPGTSGPWPAPGTTPSTPAPGTTPSTPAPGTTVSTPAPAATGPAPRPPQRPAPIPPPSPRPDQPGTTAGALPGRVRTAAVTEHSRAPGEPRRRSALAWIVLAASAGIALDAYANALGRTGRTGGQTLFWVAAALVLAPAAARMLSAAPGRGERAATVVTVGLAFYAFKVLQNPFTFTYGDEWVHLHNLQSILTTGRLFGTNTILPVTPRFPGLEASAAAIVRTTGLPDFAAGVTLIAAARGLVMLALYLIYERLTGSARVAAIGVLIYTATPTFLYFSSEFSYESLSLPLAIVAAFALIRWLGAPDRRARRRWAVVALAIDAAVIATHHLSAYGLLAFFVAVCVVQTVLRGWRSAPWAIAAGSLSMTLAWLAVVAGQVVGYLSPVVTGALNQVIQTLRGEVGTRTLFVNQNAVETTPPIGRYLALAGLAVLGVTLLLGLLVVWRRYRRQPLFLVLGVAGAAYIGALPLRLVPAAWETASRASEYLFVGVGLTAGLGVVTLLRARGWQTKPRLLVIAAAMTLIFGSGVIAGWPVSLLLSRPLEVRAGSTRVLVPPIEEAAVWSGRMLGHRQRVGAQIADARFFIEYAHQTAFAGVNTNGDIQDQLDATRIQSWQGPVLRGLRITLLVADRRTIAADNIAGFFWDVGAPQLKAPGTQSKYNRAGVDKLYDAGNIAIYGVRGLW